MEYINSIEIQGYVSSPSFTEIANSSVARFSLATEFAYKNDKGTPVVETTWFSCMAFKSDENDFSALQVGNFVNVKGRLKERRYVSSEGIEKRYFEVICQSVKLAK